jgi:WD40 repeat protein
LRPEAPTEGYDAAAAGRLFSVGDVLGERYRIRAFLGRGGMGEVWHADDLKLRVEVALKALRPDLLKDESRLELLRSEVRAAREVTSPNVCRIYDLVELDGTELVSMEYVDGTTLLEVLRDKAPMDPPEAQEIASQFLAGLEAIHQAGLVHRDVKPENIMVTRTGRVVLMDFGLARSSAEGAGSVSGTPAYMAPEQARGEAVDARADLFAAGVILAEMVSPDGVRDFESRESVWNGVRQEPPQIPDSPWAPVVKRAVAKDPENRFGSAHELTRALEEVAFRVHDETGLEPYPGLSAFSEDDAEYFFGREAEVEAVWQKLQTAQLLGIIGASGAGKSSFIGAGLVPSVPEDWSIVRCTPGGAATASLRQVVIPEIEDDLKAIKALAGGRDQAVVDSYSIWRRRHDHALLIVDQFEELFTQNSEAEQSKVADLLGRIALVADVHVLLSMRDDFLMRCHEHGALAPIFSELTPLRPPVGGALRRAVVQPALRCGYRFEDEELADEILAEVEGERGALPLLAFALARLWEKRDRENGLITRQAYQEIGGVGGALAQHAEALMERLGPGRHPIVRELFRNLVTAQGTRAARDTDELLSVFRSSRHVGAGFIPAHVAPGDADHRGDKPPGYGERGYVGDAPQQVLHALIDARLLTSYEAPSDDGAGAQRVEAIHESLISNWPRLVGWRTQDADAARLRDELRRAASQWHEHGRTDDRLWSGAAFKEFEVWRERYPGGLTQLEEAFGAAMTRHAERRRRRRRAAVAAAFVVLLGVLAIVGGFWRRSVTEARRAEAANLFSLAQLQLEKHSTATIAYAIASLGLADNPEVRRLAVEALWVGPTHFVLPTSSPYLNSLDFSSDGRWLATADPGGRASIWPSDGGPPTVLEGSGLAGEIRISPRRDVVAATMQGRQELGLWSFPEGRLQRSLALGDQGETHAFQFSCDGQRLLTNTEVRTEGGYGIQIRSWPVAGGEPDLIARLETPKESYGAFNGLDPTGSRIAWADGRRVRVARLEGTTVHLSSATSVEHDSTVVYSGFDRQGRQLVTADKTGTIRIWSLESDPPKLTHTPLGGWEGTEATFFFDDSGSMLAGMGGMLWDLTAPPEADHLLVRYPDWTINGLAIDPGGSWLATSAGEEPPLVLLWPIGRSYPRILRAHEGYVLSLAFTPDGERLVSVSGDRSIRVWPLVRGSGERSRILHQAGGVLDSPGTIAIAPDGSFLAAGTRIGQVLVVPLDGRPVRVLGESGNFPADRVNSLAVGPRARLVAAGILKGIVRIWDLASGEARTLGAGDGERGNRVIEFTEDGDLWVASRTNLRRWSLDGRQPRILEEIGLESPEFVTDELCDVDPDGRRALFREANRLWVMETDTREIRQLTSHGWVARGKLYANGGFVSSTNRLGELRIGPVTGEQPHLLLGHEDEVNAIAVSSDGRWIASGADDRTIRLWPMPDFSKPPLHALPRSELIAKLKALTNLRAVPDEESPTGWNIEVGPFPGWETVPTW